MDEWVGVVRANPGAHFMLICECSHKERGHENDVGECSRCECNKFRNTTHIKMGDETII